jgi:adenylylsulfate reductase subunit A
MNAGRGPIHMVTMEAFQDPHLEEDGCENILGITVVQDFCWLQLISILSLLTLS